MPFIIGAIELAVLVGATVGALFIGRGVWLVQSDRKRVQRDPYLLAFATIDLALAGERLMRQAGVHVRRSYDRHSGLVANSVATDEHGRAYVRTAGTEALHVACTLPATSSTPTQRRYATGDTQPMAAARVTQPVLPVVTDPRSARVIAAQRRTA